jgi:hypothetical protein
MLIQLRSYQQLCIQTHFVLIEASPEVASFPKLGNHFLEDSLEFIGVPGLLSLMEALHHFDCFTEGLHDGL